MDRQYLPQGGDTLEDTVQAMLKIAKKTQARVVATCNAGLDKGCIEVVVHPGDDPRRSAEKFKKRIYRMNMRWRSSPECARQIRAVRAREVKHRAMVQKDHRRPMPRFEFRSPRAEELFRTKARQYYRRTNVIRYASRWAHAMERKMADGAKLVDIVIPTSHDADIERVTHHEFIDARLLLEQTWIHGRKLRRLAGRS